MQVNWATYRKTLGLTAFNALVTSSIFQLMIYPLLAGSVQCSLPLPSFTKVLWDLLICAIVIEVLFYYTHRSAIMLVSCTHTVDLVKLATAVKLFFGCVIIG